MFRIYVVYPGEETSHVSMLDVNQNGFVEAVNTVKTELKNLECIRKFSQKQSSKTNVVANLVRSKEPFIWDGHFFRKIIKDGPFMEFKKDFPVILGTSKAIKSFKNYFTNTQTEYLSAAL